MAKIKNKQQSGVKLHQWVARGNSPASYKASNRKTKAK